MARIRAAEEKANQQLDAQAGSKPENVVPWQETVPKRSLTGTLTQVDCLKGAARLSVRNKNGHVITLMLDNPESANLACGVQNPPRRVAISYALQPDDRSQTAGRVVTMKLQ
jgi:hypothetical protein